MTDVAVTVHDSWPEEFRELMPDASLALVSTAETGNVCWYDPDVFKGPALIDMLLAEIETRFRRLIHEMDSSDWTRRPDGGWQRWLRYDASLPDMTFLNI